MGQNKPSIIINRDNVLAGKVQKLKTRTVDDLIERSKSMVKEEAAGFVEWVGDDLEALKSMARRLADGETPQAPHIGELFRGACSIRNQGTVCGYPLVTRVANLLCDFIDRAEQLDEREIRLVVAHVDTLQTIISSKIKNDDTELAKTFVANLESAAAKLRDDDE